MSFSGNLQDLPLVDVLQLLHATKKSGTLRITNQDKQALISLRDGFIVSASHPDPEVDIGTILIESKAATPEQIMEAAARQNADPIKRKPLIGTLLEFGSIDQQKAWRGLEMLIEKTVHDLLKWHEGFFALDLDHVNMADDYRYFPEALRQEMNLDTQMILMNALKVFDERQADITNPVASPEKAIHPEESFHDSMPEEKLAKMPMDQPLTVLAPSNDVPITAELLGLDDLEILTEKPVRKRVIPLDYMHASQKKKAELEALLQNHKNGPAVPEVKESFEENKEITHAKIEQQVTAETKVKVEKQVTAEAKVKVDSKVTIESQETVAAKETGDAENARVLIIFSKDGFVKHSIRALCREDGIEAFIYSLEMDVFEKINSLVSKKITPVLLVDSPGQISDAAHDVKSLATLLQRIKTKYPHLPLLQCVNNWDYAFFTQSFSLGTRTLLPRPIERGNRDEFVAQMVQFLTMLRTCLKEIFWERDKSKTSSISDPEKISQLKKQVFELRDPNNSNDVSLTLMKMISADLKRAVLFLVRSHDLLGIGGFGFGSNPENLALEAARLKVSIVDSNILNSVVEKGELYHGPGDNLIDQQIFKKIGMPESRDVLFLPLKTRDKTIAIIYGDFDRQGASPVQIDCWEILASQAALILQIALYKRQIHIDEELPADQKSKPVAIGLGDDFETNFKLGVS